MSGTSQTGSGRRPCEACRFLDKDLPIWVRAHTRGPEHYSGLSRAKLYELAGAGLIKTAVLKDPGREKGVRLFHLGSILEYIARHEVSPVPGKNTALSAASEAEAASAPLEVPR